MKKIKRILYLLGIILVIAGGNTVLAADGISVMLDGRMIEFDVEPQIVSGRTMVPMRKIFEAFDAKVEWNGEERKINAVKEDIDIEFIVNNFNMKKEEEVIALDVPPLIVNNRTLVPVRAIAESFDCKVDWIEEDRTVRIISKELKGWYGKTIVGYGDSLTAASSLPKKAWVGKVAYALGMKVYNRGIGGTKIDGTEDKFAWVSDGSQEAINAYGAHYEYGEYLGRPDSPTKYSPDAETPPPYSVVIKSDMSNDERICTIPENADLVCYMGGANGIKRDVYKLSVEKLQERCKNAQIICMTYPWHNRSGVDYDYEKGQLITDKGYQIGRKHIMEVSEELNLSNLNTYEDMGIDNTNASLYFSEKDPVHFNDKAHDLIAYLVIDKLKEVQPK